MQTIIAELDIMRYTQNKVFRTLKDLGWIGGGISAEVRRLLALMRRGFWRERDEGAA